MPQNNILPGVQPTLQMGSVTDAEKAHRSKMENSDGGSSSKASASTPKIPDTKRPGGK